MGLKRASNPKAPGPKPERVPSLGLRYLTSASHRRPAMPDFETVNIGVRHIKYRGQIHFNYCFHFVILMSDP